MLRIRPEHAKPGLTLALPVFHPRSHDTLLLRSGVELTERSVMRLRQMSIPEIWVQYPRLEQVGGMIDPRVETGRAAVTRDIAEAFDLAGANMHARLEYRRYEDAVGTLMRTLTENRQANVFLTSIVDSGQPALRHATNVCYLSLLIGLSLGDYLEHERPKLPPPVARDVESLGVAAMLCDIGVMRLEPDVLERYAQTQDDSDEAWQEHVLIGYEMVRGNIDPTAASAVLNHHQKFDGTGFPWRTTLSGEAVALAGRDIHVFARIIAAADIFDRLVHPAHVPGSCDLGEEPNPAVRALRQMLEPPRRAWIDPCVFAGLLQVCPPYPPGHLVTLSDGREAVVERWRHDDPCRPRVMEYRGPDWQGDLETIDLRERTDLCVASIDGVDVRADNFGPELLPTPYDPTGVEQARRSTRDAA
ncbi:MAG: HD-GYP domain-containing protein [Phycisphaerales bacterium JB040]